MKKNHHFHIRLNDNEFEYLSDIAQSYKITRGELIRRLIANQPLPAPRMEIKDLAKANADMARLGNLLNQALKKNFYNDEIMPIINDIKIQKDTITKLLKNIHIKR